MANPKQVEAFKKLIEDAPIYVRKEKPAEEKGPDIIELPNDLPSIVAPAFAKQSRVAYKYNRFDGWSIWCHGKYQRVEDVKEIRLHIRKFLNKCRIPKQKKDGPKFHEPLKKQSSGFVTDILESLAALPDVHLLPGRKAPCSLDGKLDPAYIIAAKNTLVDISSRPHVTHGITDQFYTLNYLDYDYNITTYEEVWYDFLIDIACSDIEITELLQQWGGYLLLPTLKYHKFLLCAGDGANGKGVFFDTLTAALGPSNVSNVPLAKFDNAYALFGTYGKMVNMCNENASTLARDAEAVVKEYVAGDKIFWEQKYKDAFFDYPTAKLMFATNELPKIRDASDGIWRRMILVPFNAKFKEGDNLDPDIGKKLQQPKVLATVLNWMIKGAEMLLKNDGFIKPKSSVLAVEEYREESNTARLFFAEMLEVDKTCSVVIPCTWLHLQYQRWCEDNGFKKPMNNVYFGRNLRTQCGHSRSRTKVNGRKMTVYTGIALQDDTEISEKYADEFRSLL